MYELIYTSVATKEYSDSEIAVLLEKARRKNQRLNVTGMLIYDDREIMQLLEGDKETVKNLYSTIELDDRHTSVRVFYEGEIESRAFSNWSMAYKHLDDADRSLLNEGYEPLDHDVTPSNLARENPNRGKELFLRLRRML